MATPYNPLAALNPQSKLLAAPNGFWDRTKWLNAGDVIREGMKGVLEGVPNPYLMGTFGVLRGTGKGLEQMYGTGSTNPVSRAMALAAAAGSRKPSLAPLMAAAESKVGQSLAEDAPQSILERIMGEHTAQTKPSLLDQVVTEQPASLLEQIIAGHAPVNPTLVSPPNPAQSLVQQAMEQYAAKNAAQTAARVASGAWDKARATLAATPRSAQPVTPITAQEVYDTTAGRINENLDEPYNAWVARMEEQYKGKDEKGKPFAKPWEGIFDMSQAGPAPAEQTQIPRWVPKKGTTARMQAAMADPAVKQQLFDAVKAGGEQVTGNWYHTNPLYQDMLKELGPEEGPNAFKTLMNMVAATSPRSSIPNNIRTASHYYHQLMSGVQPEDLEMGGKGSGYGSIAQKLHLQNAENFAGDKVDPYQNPKPLSFAANLMGNENVITGDTHNFRAIGMASRNPDFLLTSAPKERVNSRGKTIKYTINPRKLYQEGKLTMEQALEEPTYWDATPKKTEYGASEAWQQGLAKELGLTPADWQGKMWVGAGKMTGLGSPPETFMTTLAKRIAYTAQRTGRDPKEVKKLFLRGKIPLSELKMPVAPGSAIPAEWMASQAPRDEQG